MSQCNWLGHSAASCPGGAKCQAPGVDTWLTQAIVLADELMVAALEDGACGRACGDTPATDLAREALVEHLKEVR